MAVYDSVQPSDIASFRDRSQDRSPDPTRARSGPFLATLAHIFAQDRQYHTVMATLTASENYVSLLVRAAAAFLSGEHYFFDPPTGGESGEWTFPASGALLGLQKKFLQQMRLMFAADIADWRPNGGSVCEQAVLMAACRRGDAFVELSHNDGGHFGAGGLAEDLGAERFTFPMREDLIDVERTAGLIEQNRHIRLVLVQPSHFRRPQPIEQLAAALPRR